MKVREIMTENVHCCGPQTSVAAAAQIMCENDCGALPVLGDDGGVVGLITDRDISTVVATTPTHAAEIAVGEAMSKEVFACYPEDHVKLALNQMARAQVKWLPVVNQYGDLQGILSLTDVMACYRRAAGTQAQSVSCHDIVEAYGSICEPRQNAKQKKRLSLVARA
jgi:CBS domain-containing protein